MISRLFTFSALWIGGLAMLFSPGCRPAARMLVPGDIVASTRYRTGHYGVDPDTLEGRPLLSITGQDIIVDFDGLVIDGRQPGELPDAFRGTALYIHDARNITIRNATIHGFKIAILAERVEGLRIESCDLGHNWRPRLRSRWDREALSDWLYYHHNENREWLSYGAAIYLEDCIRPVVQNCRCRQGMNGLLLVRSTGGEITGNDFSFNSGVGIGMYRSGHHRILHNRLDWNARGYSHGQYARGQDSAGILLFEQCSHNVIAFNSATHSGDGLFLWAGQHTMDTGLGGCDSNLIYRNDFSHSIANAIEVTFSANYMIGNRLDDSRYGVWGGYSHHSLVRDNQVDGCETGIAIEHGRAIRIENNLIEDCLTGIRLWSRKEQPSDWTYAQRTDVTSRLYHLAGNAFVRCGKPFEITGTTEILANGNTLDGLPVRPDAASSHQGSSAGDSLGFDLPPLPAGHEWPALDPGLPEGRRFILVNEWGPYDFQFPLLALRERASVPHGEALSFDILGPEGLWEIDKMEGCRLVSGQQEGRLPDSIKVYCPSSASQHRIDLVYRGSQPVTDPFGTEMPAGTEVSFGFNRSNIRLDWTVSYFAYDSLLDPVHDPAKFQAVMQGTPDHVTQQGRLAYRWWGSPGHGLPEDRFAIRASAEFEVEAGEYILDVESDDGIRVWVDDRLLLENWSVHEPAIDFRPVSLAAGVHRLRLEYFEGGGLGVLDVDLRHADSRRF